MLTDEIVPSNFFKVQICLKQKLRFLKISQELSERDQNRFQILTKYEDFHSLFPNFIVICYINIFIIN